MKKIVSTLLILAVTLGLSACNFRKRPRSEILRGYFDTAIVVQDYAGLRMRDFADLAEDVREELAYYDKLLDSGKEYEDFVNIATLNAGAGKGAVKVDGEMIDFLGFAKEMYYLTEGRVNIAAGSVLSVWNKYREEAGKTSATDDNRTPDMSELEEARAHTDIEGLIIDEVNMTVELLDEQMSLDVSMLAKGYALQQVVDELREEGYDRVVLDAGINLNVIGEQEDGGAFRVGIRNPDTKSDETYLHYLDIKNTSCAMASALEKYYEVDSKKYHHLIDMESLAPAENFASVTVVVDDSGLASALSVAFFIMDFEEGRALLETLDGVRVVWVYPDGKVVDSADFDNQT